MDKRTTKLAIVFDDHLLFSDSYSSLIEKLDIVDSVHLIADKDELFRLLIDNAAHSIYIFLGYYLKNRSGIELIDEVRRVHGNTHIVVVSSVINPSEIAKILGHEPNALISKISGSKEIIECVNSIALGKQFVSRELCDIIAAEHSNVEIRMTEIELEVLKLFSAGLSIARIADEMMLAKHTIVEIRRKLMNGTNVASMSELLTLAREMKFI